MSKPTKTLLEKQLVGQVRPPPLFDWCDQLEFADQIIARVSAPTRNYSAIGRPSPTTDLTPFRDDIAKLLAELQETYLVARDDHEARNDSRRPERKLRKKDLVNLSVDDEPTIDYSKFDCSEFLNDAIDTWEQCYDDFYARPRGNPGNSRTGGPPIAPLHPIYWRVRIWWRKHDLGAS